MSDPLRNLFDKSKPLFEGKGKFARFFLSLMFSKIFFIHLKGKLPPYSCEGWKRYTKSHVVVWLATFPTMFFGMYNIGYQALSALEAINLAVENT